MLFVTFQKFMNARLYCLDDTQIFNCTMKHLHSECVYNVKQKYEVHWCGWLEFLHPPAISTNQIWLVDTMTVWSNLIGWYYDEMSTKSRVSRVKCSYLQVYTFRTRDGRSYNFRRAYPFKSFLVLLMSKLFLNRIFKSVGTEYNLREQNMKKILCPFSGL